MGHLPDLIIDLALILIAAGFVTILFKWLKQPVVLGYIVAGFIAGPHFKKFLEDLIGVHSGNVFYYLQQLPSVTDIANITTWADIGVIFLLFALGLDFSVKKLMHVGGTASIATLINMGSMIIIGYVIGIFLGWSKMDSIFLGGMLSMSSTTIIIKAFTDMGLQKKKFANIVFGMLIVEDLAAIIMMVLLSTVAVSNHFEEIELINSLLKLIFFMFIWFVVGIYLIPTIFKKLKKYLNDETLLILSVGLCLGMVLFATSVGFSAALGAFIMGSILSETIESKHIEHLVEPLKNFFGAIFFVSVGMMIDPVTIWDNGLIILLFTFVVLVGRIIFATLGVIASGQGLKVAVQSGFSLAQIGEFSFIIATLGMSLGVISTVLYPIIVAVSVITTFTTPYCIKFSPVISDYIEKHIPEKWSALITGYANTNYKVAKTQNDWHKFLKKILLHVAVNFTLAVAVIMLCKTIIMPFMEKNISGISASLISAAVTLLLMSPFLWSIIMRKNSSVEFKKLWKDNHFNKGALSSLIFFRGSLAMALILFVLIPLFPKATILLVILAFAFTIGVAFSQGFKGQSKKIENRFLQNLHQKQAHKDKKAAIPTQVANDIKSKDLHIEEFRVSPDSPIIGKSLKEINFKQTAGVYVVSILRGSNKINIPDANERVYPYDELIVIGSDEEFSLLNETIHYKDVKDIKEACCHINLSQYEIEKDSPLIGKTLQEADIRSKTKTMIISIERDDESITEIPSDFIFREGDTLWLAGEEENLNAFDENVQKL
jgi:Kef-type K+ transport systems, membrane components